MAEEWMITNGNHYCVISGKNAVGKTTDPSLARRFPTRKDAEKVLGRATKKLKGYKVVGEMAEAALDAPNETVDRKDAEIPVPTPRIRFPQELRNRVYDAHEGRCGLCGKFIPHGEFTVDHVVPLANGGTNEFSNLQPCCRLCNEMKGRLEEDEMAAKIASILKKRVKASGWSKKKSRKFLDLADEWLEFQKKDRA